MSLACSVIIPAFNASETIGDQLAALASQRDAVSFEVIIADNGSSDDLLGTSSQWRDQLRIQVVDASARRGPSAARNIGVAYACAPLLLFCDADDVVAPSWVSSLTSALGGAKFAGGPCFPFADRPGIWLPEYDTHQLPMAWDSWRYAFAGNLAITRDAWAQVGGFDETLTGAEEIEFAWRARELGIEPVFVPEAVIKYRVRPSLRGRLWHEYNSGRGTATVASRLRPQSTSVRSWRSQARHNAMLMSRFPKSIDARLWASWAAVLAFEAGSRAGRRNEQHTLRR